MSSDFIDRVRDASHIETVAGDLTELNGRGRRLSGCCPFHQEDSPSFVVYVDQNSWHCYGCGRGGSVFDLVMERDKCDFWEAAVHLANKAGIPLPELTEEEKKAHIEREKVETLLSQYAAACHRELEKHPDVVEYLHTRGITDESIKEFGIGVGFKLPKSINTDVAKLAGITDSRLVGRVIFPVRRGGKVVQISARRTKEEEKIKYLSLSRELYPYNAHRLRGERVILVEGVMDVILLEQAGFEATATVSANFSKDWLRLVGRDTDCFVCYDKDDSGTGAAANDTISEKLFDAGHKAYVIDLPEGHDPASFVQAQGAGAFQELLDGARSYIDYLIEGMPVGLNGYDLPKVLERIYAKLSRLPATSHERYTAKIAERLELGKITVRKGLREYLKDTKKRDDSTSDTSTDEWRIRRRTTNPIFFNPSQDYIKDTLYYTIWFEIEGLGTFKPFIITSNKDCFPFDKGELLKRDMICRTSALPSNYGRWSIGTDNPYNALDYLDGKVRIDPKDLYQKIKWYFKRFVRLPDPFYYDFLTCWCMATYHFRLYDSFGYIFINAMKRSGKTQTLSIMQHLVFNASMADALTEAVLKRRVNVDAATIIADEAEYFKAKLKDEKSMVFEVFNGGYKRTGRATMVDPDTKTVEDFCTYSPKALANTQGLYDVLADRCITLYLLRTEQSIPQFIEADQAGRLQQLRDMLYCFSLEYISEIAETKKGLVQPENLPGRDWELWYPVLATAAFLDNYGVVEPREFKLTDGSSKVIPTLLERMVTMAVERRQYRKALEEEMQPEPRILQSIWRHVCENESIDDYYPTSELCDSIKDDLGWDKYAAKSLSRFVFDTTKLANRNNKEDHIQRPYYDTAGRRRKMNLIRLKKDIVSERAKQLFGLVLDDESVPESLERNPFDDD